jgi:basic amino acid/polyamine antiporter, APA family
MFLCAKTASAATAALGFAGYLLQLLGLQPLIVPVAITAGVALTAIILLGIRRSNLTNIIIVSVTLFALAFFVLAALPGMRSLMSANDPKRT